MSTSAHHHHIPFFGYHRKKMTDNTQKWILSGPVVALPQLQKPFGTFLLERLASHGDKVLQVDGETGEILTAAQLLDRAKAVAEQLRLRGVSSGDIVSGSMENSLHVSSVVLGTLFIGAVYAPFNPDLHPDDLRHILKMLEPKVVFCTPRRAEVIQSILPTDSEVVEIKSGGVWDDFLRTPTSNFQPLEEADLDAHAFILGSSGTTGAPKGVMVSHKALHHVIAMVDAYEAGLLLEVKDQDVVLLVLSNFWVSGLLATLFNFHKGFRMIIYRKFDVDVILGAVQKHKVTTMTLSPPQVSAVAKHPNVEQYDVSSLKSLGFGGARLSPAMRELAERRLKKNFSQYYGLTECLFGVLPGRLSPQKPNSVGCTAMNTVLKVLDPENGSILGPHSEGEICFKNPMIFNGYYKNPNATSDMLDKDGWIHTGDVGYFDEDGYLYICDRYKELVKYRGVHISPAEVEGVLMSHEAVQDAAVVGIEHDEDQEHPVGFVVLQKGKSATKEELMQIVKDQLPEYKQLHGGVFFVDKIPRTATDKVKRRELRQMARTS